MLLAVLLVGLILMAVLFPAASVNSRRVVAPTITSPAVLTWDVQIGTSPTITPPTYTGSPGTITYTLRRDGVPVSGLEDVSQATIEAHVGVGVTGTDARDIGPDIDLAFEVTNSAGSDSGTSNVVTFDDATHLPDTAIGVSTAGLTLADSDTTVDQWAATLGGQTALMGPLVAPAATNRLAYSASGGVGGRPLATGDGIDNVLGKTVTKGSAWGGYDEGLVGRLLSNGAGGDSLWLWSAAAGDRIRMRELTTGTLIQLSGDDSVGTFINAVGTTNEATNGLWSGNYDDAADLQEIRFNGTVEGSAAQNRGAYADGLPWFIMGSATGTIATNFAAQGWYRSTRQLTSTERAHVRSLLTYHTGIAC